MTSLRLSKTEMLRRLGARSKARYGGEFSEGCYDDLVDVGLIDSLERASNKGLAPVFYATCAHYRRALQLKRLRQIGVSRRDAQLIQLFVRGYGVKPWQVDETLRRELIRAIEKLRPMMRSGYFQKARKIGPRHMAVVTKQLGPLDERLADAGLRQTDEFYLELARIGFGLGVGKLADLIGGILIANKGSDPLPEFIEKALKFDSDAYLRVRDAFALINRRIFRPTVGDGVINSPEFTICALTAMLAADKAGFSIEDLFANLPAPERFQALIADFQNALVPTELSD